MSPKDRVKEILAEKLGVELTDIDNQSLLLEDLGVDGIILAEVLESIKTKTNVEVPIEEVKEVQTVSELENLVEEHTLE
ncbi:MAG: hypothetical protein A3D26_02450 [Candidatus Blackburnbacteria bacterium RIFCSPHIGHO2_02_FULL_44_20]|uniref:Carrier domain-containing protein n=1 Tax=Candidatus Blackburnbacteria bacterium RIFCSPHIGHO2_02_FULL_44_20 TaxID=1797516 RepID=A0A1G1V7M3_9BACT|nr:MAG: hypothetical protein A3E16_03255 [Candidatus Blackburnbacteria bacterium RIFCSPHIGHO2_12_FULL_44_25]OGY11343.1 MAG: hypothetical protein A3D26_02450 [Candidatus Blackburnbacteria bacterium RIFCSPHIGHO2_02_FULL_44_20]